MDFGQQIPYKTLSLTLPGGVFTMLRLVTR